MGELFSKWSQELSPTGPVLVIFIAFALFVNLLGVRFFGELEFWTSSLKVITLIGLILMGIIIDLGGNPKHDRIGFR